MATGVVKWYDPTKGFGFVQPEGGGKDVFVHVSAVERAGHGDPQEGDYRAEPGEPEDKGEQSFPSGHTAGAVAVAGVLSALYPPATVPLYSAAAVASLIQAPTAKHYPSDIAAGAAIGGVSAFAVHVLFSRLWPPRPTRLRDRAGQAALARWRRIAG